jgi:hypothetical protein
MDETGATAASRPDYCAPGGGGRKNPEPSSGLCSFDAARLGIGGRTGREWFTKYSLSRALHTRPDEIQKWIGLGWLRSRALTTAGVQAHVIYADDFCEFVEQHGRSVVGRPPHL